MSRLKTDIETAYTPNRQDVDAPSEHEAIIDTCVYDSCNTESQ